MDGAVYHSIKFFLPISPPEIPGLENGAKTVVIDLSDVEFMDSSRLSALVSGMKALRRTGGQLNICNATAQIRTAMRLTMLDRVFPIFDSVAEVLANSSESSNQSPG